MIRIRLNGEEREVPAATVAELVASLGLDPRARGTAVAVNENVVPRARWEETPLAPGDAVEVIHAVGGG